MKHPKKIQNWSPLRFRPNSVSDVDILAELEFHLEMRTQENLQCGMLPDAARKDARKRFGDFERSYQACRRISHGFHAVVYRLHSLFVLGLAVTVVYLGGTLWKTQASFDAQIQSLQARVDARSTTNPTQVATTIPYVHWRPPSLPATLDIERQKTTVSLVGQFATHRLNQPWSDWKILDENPAQLHQDFRNKKLQTPPLMFDFVPNTTQNHSPAQDRTAHPRSRK